MAEYKIDGKSLLSSIEIEFDISKLERTMFGFLGWRKKLALLLFWAGARVLGVGVEVKGDQ